MLAAMLGLSGIMQAGSAVFEVVRCAGAAYLVFAGVSMIRDAGAVPLDDGDPPTGSMGVVGLCAARELARRGLTVALVEAGGDPGAGAPPGAARGLGAQAAAGGGGRLFRLPPS